MLLTFAVVGMICDEVDIEVVGTFYVVDEVEII
jgi:hypothetical protein